MTKKQMENIRDYVREQGGASSCWAARRASPRRLLPHADRGSAAVTMEVKQKIEIRPRGVLSIDRPLHGHDHRREVTKLDIAKEAAHLVVDLLDERTRSG